MPSNITDVDEFTDPVTAPADGDNADEASFQDPIQDLSNRTRYLKNRTDELFGGTPTLTDNVVYGGAYNVTFPQQVNAGGDVVAGDDLVCIDDVHCGGDVFATGSVFTNGASVTNDITSAAGNITAAAGRVMGAFRFNTALGVDADTDLTVLTDAQMLVTRTLTGNRAYTIDDTGAVNGDCFFVKNDTTSGFTLTVKKPGGTNIAALADGESCLAVRVNGVWSAFNFEL